MYTAGLASTVALLTRERNQTCSQAGGDVSCSSEDFSCLFLDY